MTYSTGPGGYGDPSQAAGSPGYGQQAPGYAAAPGRSRGLGFYLNIGVVALGLLSFFLGFASYWTVDTKGTVKGNDDTSINFFANVGLGVGTIALTVLLTAALIAAFDLFPKQQNHESVVAALSVAGFVSLLFLLFGLQDSFGGAKVGVGVGLILVLITSFLQAAVAVVALLLASGVVKPPAPRQAQYGGYYGQPGVPPGYGQPQQPYYGQQGAPGAPTYQSPPSQPIPQAPPPSSQPQPPAPPSSQPQPPQNPW
jgi:hypothetical protein